MQRRGRRQINWSISSFDKGELANTLYEDYQFGKFVQAFPSTIPARSDLSFQAGSREEILGGWNTYANEHHLDLHKNEAVTAVTRQDDSFEVKTAAATYRASNVILAIGKLGNPTPSDHPRRRVAAGRVPLEKSTCLHW